MFIYLRDISLGFKTPNEVDALGSIALMYGMERMARKTFGNHQKVHNLRSNLRSKHNYLLILPVRKKSKHKLSFDFPSGEVKKL